MVGRWYANRKLALKNMETYAEQTKEDVYLIKQFYGRNNKDVEYAYYKREDLIVLSSVNIIHYFKYIPKSRLFSNFNKVLKTVGISPGKVSFSKTEDDNMIIIYDDEAYMINIFKVGSADSFLNNNK